MARRSHVKIESCSRSQTGSMFSGSPRPFAPFLRRKQPPEEKKAPQRNGPTVTEVGSGLPFLRAAPHL